MIGNRPDQTATAQGAGSALTRIVEQILNGVPSALYLTDPEGWVTFFNEATVRTAGRQPVLGVDRWCVCWRLHSPDGSLLTPDRSPVAIALRESRAVQGVGAIAEKPSGERVRLRAFAQPLRDDNGRVVGGVSTLVELPGPDTRSEPRQPHHLRLRVHCHGRYQLAVATDATRTGLRLEGVFGLFDGDQVILEFEDGHRIGARVRWASGRRVGVSLDTPLPESLLPASHFPPGG